MKNRVVCTRYMLVNKYTGAAYMVDSLSYSFGECVAKCAVIFEGGYAECKKYGWRIKKVHIVLDKPF